MPSGDKILRTLRGDPDQPPSTEADVTAIGSPAPPVETDTPLTEDEANALLAESARAFDAGELDQARRAFEDLQAAGRFTDWAAFRIGMIERELGDDAAAEQAFTTAIARTPDLFWAHYERLRLPSVRDDRRTRDGYAEAVLDIGWDSLQPAHVAQLEQVALAVWRDGRHDLAGRLLAKLWPSEALSVAALTKIVETALDPELVEAASTRIASLPGGSGPASDGHLDLTVEQGAFDTAVHDFGAGRLAAAAAGFERLTTSPRYGAWAHFYLGRTHAAGEDQTRAWRAFDAAIEADPALFWPHYERLVLAAAQSAEADTLIGYLEAIAATKWETLQPNHVHELEHVAHVLWDGGKTREAAGLLARLWPSTDLTQLALVRLVETDAEGDIQRGAVDRLHSTGDLDETALRVLSDYHQRRGENDREVSAMERAFELKPKDFQPWLSLVRAHAKTGDREKALAAIADGTDFSPKQRLFVGLIAHLELGDLDEAFFAFRDHCRLYAEVPKFPGIRLAYLLGDIFDVPRRDEVVGILTSYFPGDKDIALVLVNAAMRDQRWGDARQVFDAHFADMTDMPQNVRLANIDILAYGGRIEEAAARLEAERVDGALPVPFLRSTIRILAELDRWSEVFDAGLSQLGDDLSFRHFLSPVIRASRKVNGSERLLAGLLALPRPLKETQLDAVYAVAEDLAEQGHKDVLSRLDGVDVPFERQHRIALKLRGRARPEPVEKDLCIYYCADHNYLMPALVSLTALAMSNISVTRRAVFHLVVDADVVPFAQEAGGAIAQRLGLSLVVTDASTIVSSAERLRTSYGLFTGGQSLSLAAYYRIFFARWLVDQRRYAQALYVDADTIVRGGLGELFAMERGVPLLARHETDRPEVRHATAVHRLKGTYFNSGVLRFDLEHPDLPALLDRAIAAAIDPEVELIFQDQCALNIAFDMNAAQLPDRFNYFNPPNVSGDRIAAAEAVIVHFLDRPKPWDGLYRRRAREWFDWYDLVETLRQDGTLGI